MILNTFLYLVVPSIIFLEKIIKKTGQILLVYYLIIILVVTLFFNDFRELFMEENEVDTFFSLLKALSVIIYPLVSFFAIEKVNANVVKIIFNFINYILYPIVLVYIAYLTIRFGNGSEMEIEGFIVSDLILTVFMLGSAIILLGLVIKDKININIKLFR